MKIATVRATLPSKVGDLISGYGPNFGTIAKHDELEVNGFCLDDGKSRALFLSFDILGLDREVVLEIRSRCAEALNCPPSAVLLSCTHTHGAPAYRSNAAQKRDPERTKELIEATVKSVQKIEDKDFVNVDVFSYSNICTANTNRRYLTPDNKCYFVPHHIQLEKLANGICDPEVGVLLFRPENSDYAVEVFVNYAAHPLASHAPGLAGHSITADFPAEVRKYIEAAIGGHCSYFSGAAGDQFPVDSQVGDLGMETIAKPLSIAVIKACIDIRANLERYKIKNPELRSQLVEVEGKIRPNAKNRVWCTGDTYNMELQLLSIGSDVCMIGVPGELLGEVGLEMKWHSPFRHTWIAYNSTDYVSYLCHANAIFSGGYEARMQQFEPRIGLKLVNSAVDAMFEMCPEISTPEW